MQPQTPMTPGASMMMNPYAQQQSYFGAAGMMPGQNPYMMMPGQQYDPYGYDPYSMYQQQMPGYGMGGYNPAVMGPMSMYDPTFRRLAEPRFVPERNYISSVKDLWQSSIY